MLCTRSMMPMTRTMRRYARYSKPNAAQSSFLRRYLPKLITFFGLGLADSCIIATAERLGINHVLTVDERDFRAVKPATGSFVLLPADA